VYVTNITDQLEILIVFLEVSSGNTHMWRLSLNN